ncbi:MAG: hypothetical protein R8J94_20850 [Acidimicrobiia bacterium]|nr:hypothetical protein [Acidimicrobiia bacterium]
MTGAQDSFRSALERDHALAAEFGVEFTVVAGRARHETRGGPPELLGTFDNPAEAVDFARSHDHPSITVLANGTGAYWHTAERDTVVSELLERVCRDLRLGPEKAEVARRLDTLRSNQSTLRAESVLFEAAEIVVTCADENEAIAQLVASPLGLSRGQARQLLWNNNGLRRLTTAGKRELADQLTTIGEGIAELEAALPVVD